MNLSKLYVCIFVSILVAILLSSVLNGYARVADDALASSATLERSSVQTLNVPDTIAKRNYLPIIFLNSATAGGAWYLAGNAGTNPANDFLGTTDNVTLTLRVNNSVGWRLAPGGGNTPNVIGGYSGNNVSSGVAGATIGGGGANSSINSVTGNYATVGGGIWNTASTYATVGGGYFNRATNSYATIGGGYSNSVSNQYTTIGGGGSNTVSGQYATIGGGNSNIANGQYATIPGGYQNQATMTYTFAAGNRAQALHQGSFVWADSTNASFASTG